MFVILPRSPKDILNCVKKQRRLCAENYLNNSLCFVFISSGISGAANIWREPHCSVVGGHFIDSLRSSGATSHFTAPHTITRQQERRLTTAHAHIRHMPVEDLWYKHIRYHSSESSINNNKTILCLDSASWRQIEVFQLFASLHQSCSKCLRFNSNIESLIDF